LLFNGIQPEISSPKSNEELISMPAVDFLSNVDLKIVEKARADHKSSPFKQLLEGAPLTKFVEDYPQTLLKLPQMEKSLALYKLKKQEEKHIEEIKENTKNLQKKRHVWIFGTSNSGKTSYVRKLTKLEPDNWFKLPKNDDWRFYNNQRYLWLDEFVGKKITIEELNEICDGDFQVNTKGGSKKLRPDCIVYVCSEFSIEQSFKITAKKAPERLDALYNRFNVFKKFPSQEPFDVQQFRKYPEDDPFEFIYNYKDIKPLQEIYIEIKSKLLPKNEDS
jgi:hypothetical protein